MPFKKGDPRANESRRKHYRNNREQYFARNNVLRKEMREYLNEIKSGKCKNCKKTYDPCVMDFHHRDPKQKIGTIAVLVSRGSWKNLKNEVEKCDLLCANCHRIVTHKPIHLTL